MSRRVVSPEEKRLVAAIREAQRTFDYIAPLLEKAGYLPAFAANGRRALQYALKETGHAKRA